MIFLGDEVVQARPRLEERSIERALGSIVRKQMELTAGWSRGERVENGDGREGETAKACRDQDR
jgi:hypothetical protein